MWTFNVKKDKVEEFEALCQKYGYDCLAYYDDGWYEIETGSEEEPTEFYNDCVAQDLLILDKWW